MSALRMPSATSSSTSSSRAVSPAGFSRVDGPRAAPEIADSALPEHAADAVGGRPRAEPLQLRQAPAKRRLVRAARAARAPLRTGSRARATASPPPPARRPARDGTARRGRVAAADLAMTGAPAPVAQLADRPRVGAVLERERERPLRLGGDELGLARQPVRLGARSRDRREPLHLAASTARAPAPRRAAPTDRPSPRRARSSPSTTSDVILLGTTTPGRSRTEAAQSAASSHRPSLEPATAPASPLMYSRHESRSRSRQYAIPSSR